MGNVKGHYFSNRSAVAAGWACLPAFLLVLLVWGCRFRNETPEFKHQLENLFDLSPKWVRVCPVDSVRNLFPWSEWQLDWYRPGSCIQALFETLEGDSIRLTGLSFPKPYLAFGLYNRQVSLFSKGKNFFFAEETALLHQDNLFFSLHLSGNKYWNRQKLSVFCKNLDSTGTKPRIFDSFPVHNRILNSETVIPYHFLGVDFLGEVVGVKYECFFDTAFVFRSFFNPDQSSFVQLLNLFTGRTDTLESGEILEFWGNDSFNQPIFLRGLSGRIIGCSGCSDRQICKDLTQKTQKMDALLPKAPHFFLKN